MNGMIVMARWGVSLGRWWIAAAFIAGLLASPLAAFGQANPRNFDHSRTGFNLNGIHALQACESCHVNGVFRGTPRDCASCHTSGSVHAQGNTVKPQRHVPAVVSCDSCHSSQTFAGRTKFSHGLVQGFVSCQTCHDGNGATGRTPTHIPVSAAQSCGDCHKRFDNWLPTRFLHTEVAVAGRCNTCHNGRFPPADGENRNHVPYQLVAQTAALNCDNCHRGSFNNFLGGRVHSAVLVVAQCRICHDNNRFLPAVGQPATPSHVNAAPDCEVCHRSTTNWGDASVVQLSAGANARAKAGGAAPAAKATTAAVAAVPGVQNLLARPPNGHVPVPAGALCEGCHRSTRDYSVGVRMNHRVVGTASCKSCHNGAFQSQGTVGAQAKPVNHIPEGMLLNGGAMDCKACHINTASWTAVRMDHNNSPGGAAGACKTCHQKGANFLGNMEKEALNHLRGRGAAALDCSDSGCHRPQGRVGVSFRSWR